MRLWATGRSLAMYALVLIAFAACGSDEPAGPGGGGGGGTPTPVSTTAVQVLDDRFNPVAILVAPGATVTWTWGGANPHNVIWAAGTLANSQTVTTGTHQVTMPQAAGEYVYYCSLHGTASSGMRGTVRVQ